MVGSANEPLPRLQNLQADYVNDSECDTSSDDNFATTVVPVYRYPGNYSGIEFPTHKWSTTSRLVKVAAELALRPLYVQHLNHCVTNLYRDGSDNILHHSDKDLDLNRDGVIVSISFGSQRIMGVRSRTFPHDVTRLLLPPGSMFLLGPWTNANCTHSILPWED